MAKNKSFITFLLNLIAFILETLLSSAASRRHSTNNDDQDTYRDSNGSDTTATKFKAALNYFELADNKDAAALRESIKKKYRKLSLLHHPDRNDNSEESVKEMQKVNHHYNVLNEELDRREGIVHEEDEVEESEPASQEEEPTEEDTREKSKKKKKGKGRKTKNKPSKASREKARSRRQEEQARKEQDKEWQEIQRQQQQIKNMKRKMFTKVQRERTRHDLNTEEGRKQANFKFEEAMGFTHIPEAEVVGTPASMSEDERTASMHDIDDDGDQGIATPESPAASASPASDFEAESFKKEKPKNLVMECCLDDVAVALRLGLPDAAMETIQKRISQGVYRKLLSLNKAGRESDFEWAAATATTEFLREPLDEDGNTILHYAVYYESMDVISMLYFYACKCDAMPDIFLQENRYGHIPVDFCKCCVKNDALPERMKSLTETARAAQPSLDNSLQRLKTIVANIDWVSVLNAAASILVGVGLFDVRIFVAAIVTTIHLWSTEGGTPEWRVATLFAWHNSWWVLKSILNWIPFNWYSAFVLLLLTPLVLYSHWDRVVCVVLLVPTVSTFFALCVTTHLRVPALLRKHRLDDIYFLAFLWIGTVLAGWFLSGLWHRISKLVFWFLALPGRVWNKLGSLFVGGGGDRAAVKSGAVRSEGLQRALDLHRQALGGDEDDLEF